MKNASENAYQINNVIQEIFTILAREKLEAPVLTTHSGVAEVDSVDYLRATSSLEKAHKWYFEVIKSAIDCFETEHHESVAYDPKTL